MHNHSGMAVSFEREKNLKASVYTAAICALLFLFLFFMQWALPQIPAPDYGEGIEVNLGNSETGLGNVPPQVPGEASAQSETQSSPPLEQAAGSPAKVQADAYDDGDAPAISKTKPEKHSITAENLHKTEKKVVNTPPVPKPPKPKAVFKGGTSTQTSGNQADSYNNVRDQGIAGGKGDQGKPNGNPVSDSYTGNAPSGNGGAGGTGGVSIRSGLEGRRIVKLPSFQDDFNENAKVAVDITVDAAGNVIMAIVNQRGTTTANQHILDIALRKARSLKLNSAAAQQTGTLVFNFRVRG